MKPVLSIVIVNWNAKDYLRKCLDSILGVGSSYPFEIIVVDNASSDGSYDMLKSEFSESRLIECKKNLGYGRAANMALRDVYTKYVLLLNSDVELFPKSVDLMMKFALSHPEAAVVGPMLTNLNGTLQYSCRKFPSFKMGTLHALLGAIFPSNPYTREYKLADWDYSKEREIDWLSGACMFLRQEAVREVGFFDEGYFMYAEDMDLCWRMREDGWKVYYTPYPKVLHHVGASSRLQSSRAIVEHHKSVYRFLSKFYYKEFPSRLLRYIIAIGLTGRAVFLLIAGFFSRILKSLKR